MKKYIILITIIILTCGCNIKPQIEKETEVIDGLNFKVEYENYNTTNYELNIEKDNNIKYLDLNNINQVFSSNSVIFIGEPSENQSRYVINTILNISKDYPDIKIYYYNYKENEPIYELKDEELIKTKEGTKLYNELSTKLSKYLTPRTIEQNEKVYKTQEKMFNNSAIIFNLNQKIYGYYDEFEFDMDGNNITLDELYLSLIKDGFEKINTK